MPAKITIASRLLTFLIHYVGVTSPSHSSTINSKPLACVVGISDSWQQASNVASTCPFSRFFVHMIRRIDKHIRQLHDTRGKTGDVGDASNDGRFRQALGVRDHVLVLTGRKLRVNTSARLVWSRTSRLHVCHRGGGSGHAENDPSTLPWLADNFHLAAVKQHDPLHDRQPEARAARGL